MEASDVDFDCVHTAFLSAAGYAASSVLYNFGDPPFTHDVYTIGPFQVNNFCQHNFLLGALDGLFRCLAPMGVSMAQ